jgi:plasmid stability protein
MPTQLHDALRARAKADERSMAQAIRYAITVYVNGGRCPDEVTVPGGEDQERMP